jgi:hypothetical protein
MHSRRCPQFDLAWQFFQDVHNLHMAQMREDLDRQEAQIQRGMRTPPAWGSQKYPPSGGGWVVPVPPPRGRSSPPPSQCQNTLYLLGQCAAQEPPDDPPWRRR